MILTHVCRNWRNIALSTSVLWTHIVIPTWKQALAGIDMLLVLWLGRVGDRPLDVSIRLLR